VRIGFGRNYLRVPISALPGWVRVCLLVFVGCIVAPSFGLFGHKYDNAISLVGMGFGFLGAFYIAFLAFGQFMKTGSND